MRELASRLAVARLERRFGRRPVLGIYVLINCAIAMAILSVTALLTQEPFVFPSLGATAFILFFAPLSVQSAPRNVLCGQLIGVLSGLLALLIFGLTGVPADLEAMSWTRTGAVTLALALTGALLVWLDVPHAPAAATAMIVALGVIAEPIRLTVVMAAVVLLLGQAYVMNRLAGLPYPLWRPLNQSVVSTEASG